MVHIESHGPEHSAGHICEMPARDVPPVASTAHQYRLRPGRYVERCHLRRVEPTTERHDGEEHPPAGQPLRPEVIALAAFAIGASEHRHWPACSRDELETSRGRARCKNDRAVG